MKIGAHHTEATKERMRNTNRVRILRSKTRRAEACALKNGDMVVCSDGTVGLLAHVRVWGTSSVQFGASGPFRQYPWKTLRCATMKEIKDAGLYGVGCNQSDSQ